MAVSLARPAVRPQMLRRVGIAVLLSLDKWASKQLWLPLKVCLLGVADGECGEQRCVCTPYLLFVSACLCLSVPSRRPNVLPGLHPQSKWPIATFIMCPPSSYTMLMMQKATDWWRFACFQYLFPSSAFATTPHCSLACHCHGSRAVKAESQNLDAELHRERKKAQQS